MSQQTLSKNNLQRMMSEYDIDTSNDDLDDDTLNIINNVSNLPDPDKIILYLYAELQSYRKLAKILNVSFTTAYKSILNIRKKILDN